MGMKKVSITKPNIQKIVFSLLLLISLFIVGRISIEPGLIRPLIFLVLFLLLFSFSIFLKEKIIAVLVVYLALMGLFRRALIPIAGWSGFDPLLILGPSITVVIALMIFWENKNQYSVLGLKPDKIMSALFVMGCIQMFNPLSGSPVSGLVASIYIIIPWLWYFISFYRITQTDVAKLFHTIEIVGTVIALYGLYQTFYGILPFEQMWVDITGYAALYLADNTVRSIGTFPSAQEFVFFTMITFMIAFSRMVLKRSYIIHLPVVLITFVSIFFASTRMIIFFMAIAVFLILILSKKSAINQLITGLVTLAVFFAIWSSLPKLNPTWFGVAEPAVEHMIEGLVDPLSEDQTGLGHIERFVDGMKMIFTNPVGHGIASVTKAADKSGSTDAMSTEIDISNMIVATGVGGFLYILVIINTFYKVFSLIQIRKTPEIISILGILVGGFGTWLNGGFYTASIIVWLLVGWIHKEYIVSRGERNAFSSS